MPSRRRPVDEWNLLPSVTSNVLGLDMLLIPIAPLRWGDLARKRCETGAWEAPEAIPGLVEGVLGGRCPSRVSGLAAKLEGKEGALG